MWLTETTADQEPVAAIHDSLMYHGQNRPIKHSRPLGSLAHGEPMPVLFGYQNRLDFPGFCQQIAAVRALNADRIVAGDGQGIGITRLLKPGAQIHRAAIDGVSYHPGERQARLSGPLKHMQSQLPFGMKLESLSNSGLLTPLTIIEPVFWQIQVPINERVPSCGDVAQKDSHLAVL